MHDDNFKFFLIWAFLVYILILYISHLNFHIMLNLY